MKTDVNTYLNTIGNPGERKRLIIIASLNLGERSEAAKRVVSKREDRLNKKLKQ